MTKSKDIKFIIKLSLILFCIVFISTILLTFCNYLTEEKIASLLPRYEDNKSLKKCYGNVDKDFAADILRRLFS